MKKILLLLFMSILGIQIINAQVIEIFGKGLLFPPNDVNPVSLKVTDLANVEQVIVEVAVTFDYGTEAANPSPTPPADVTFTSGSYSVDAPFVMIDPSENYGTVTFYDGYYHSGGKRYLDGYYTAVIEAANLAGDGFITLDKNGQLDGSIKTFYAYVYRSDDVVFDYSLLTGDVAHVYKNGSGDPVVREFTLPEFDGVRDMSIAIPFSDNESEAERYAVVSLDVENGPTPIEVKTAILLNSEVDNLTIQTIELSSIPGDYTQLRIEIYSPVASDNEGVGDSFILGSPVLSVSEYSGCSLTQGYWKTHSSMGPAPYDDTWALLASGASTPFYLSGQSWYEVFWTPVGGNVYYQAAHQYMAAYLNSLNGIWVPTDVQDAMDAAVAIFSGATPEYYEKVKGKSEASKTEIKVLNSIASILASYNEGEIGPGHCGDLDLDEKSASIEINQDKIEYFTIYPNPAKKMTNVSFLPIYNGEASVELYNLAGQKIEVLYHNNVMKNIPINIEFDAQHYNDGVYILQLRNNSEVVSKKLKISK